MKVYKILTYIVALSFLFCLIPANLTMPAYATSDLDSVVTNINIPDTMIEGETINVSITLRNTGLWAWDNVNPYRLGAGINNNILWGGADYAPSVTNQRIFIKTSSVPTNDVYTFNFSITAPNNPTTITVAAQMVLDGYAWFGEVMTKNISVLPIAVTGVTLNKTTMTIGKNNVETLIPTIAPANATNKAVTWSSSNTAVATVDANGVVTGTGVGTSTITVTTVDGAITATCAVTGVLFDATKYYKSMNAKSTKAMDVTGGSTAANAILIQKTYLATNSAQWQIVDIGSGYYKIVNKNSGLVADITSASKTNGAKLIQKAYTGANSQKWTITDVGSGYYKIVNKNSSKAIDVSGASIAEDAQLVQNTYTGAENQKWKLSVDTPFNYTIGAKQTIVTKNSRTSMGLNWWNDGCFGVVKNGTDYSFFAANGSNSAKTNGTLDNIANSVSYTGNAIQNLKDTYNYAAGGPIYKDLNTGNLIMLYHFEKHRDGDYTRFYSGLGMAKSTDGGSSFVDLGKIITANVSYESPNCPDIVEMTGAPYTIKDGYMYVYFADYLESGGINSLAVARASVSDILTAAASGDVTSFYKYYNGSFSQAALGGLSSYLENGNPYTRWMDVSYNSYLDRFVMVIAQNTIGSQVNLFLTTSTDGINWSPRTQIESEGGESFYPSIVGLGNDPKTTGTSFYLYYTHSVLGGFDRWSDAEVVRRIVTVG